jgi:hypothetical protein
MKTPYLIILLFICGCQNIADKNNPANKPSKTISINEKLIITSKDSFTLHRSSYRDLFPEFSDSSNSLCQLVDDTLKLFLNTGDFHSLKIQIAHDSFSTSINRFGNYSKYVYTPYLVHITLNKHQFQANDYIIAQITCYAEGKPQNVGESRKDTAFFDGKIRLKIRDSKFTFEDFNIENERNDFYAKLKQRPDTVKKLNLFGCAFTDIPKELTLFTNLEELDLTGNDMSMSDFDRLKNIKTLKSLNLTECNLSNIPRAILQLRNLETLSIWNNKINSIPEELYDMTSLKNLTIGNNNLNYLSPKISQLINLESFESSSTNIKVYPNEMVRLKKLREIYPNDTMRYIPAALIKYTWGCDTVLSK